MILSVQIPDDLNAELNEAAKLGYPEFNKSGIARECLRIGLPKLKKSFISRDKSSRKKNINQSVSA